MASLSATRSLSRCFKKDSATAALHVGLGLILSSPKRNPWRPLGSGWNQARRSKVSAHFGSLTETVLPGLDMRGLDMMGLDMMGLDMRGLDMRKSADFITHRCRLSSLMPISVSDRSWQTRLQPLMAIPFARGSSRTILPADAKASWRIHARVFHLSIATKLKASARDPILRNRYFLSGCGPRRRISDPILGLSDSKKKRTKDQDGVVRVSPGINQWRSAH